MSIHTQSANLQTYAWEFLRRNARYQKEYRALEKKLGQDPETFHQKLNPVWLALYVDPIKKVAQDYPGIDIKQVKEGFIEIGRFKEKWGISTVVHPQVRQGPSFQFAQFDEAETTKPPMAVEILGGHDQGPVIEENALKLRIHLNASKREILRQIEDIVNTFQRIHAEQVMGQVKSPRWAHYDEVLRVYDLVEEKGLSPQEAAVEMYPDFQQAEEKDREEMLQRIQQNVQTARRWVDLAPDFQYFFE